ncbi:hypothetical protein [Brevibacterium zhoupengii]|uniref:hypothetical protein n=1 Tax=Brevibacterium zhoupengii TaxID=2898795 RepID=UPI001E3F0171|nr:hypothetical protein [Brevibacterium zhoupengii]
MDALQVRQRVLKYAANVVQEVTYYSPDRRRITALGPVGDHDLEAMGERPAKNFLARARELTWTPYLISTQLRIPLFWVIPGAVFVGLTIFGPFSMFTDAGFLGGIWAGMANTGISVGVGAGLYLLEFWLAKREAAGWKKYDRLVFAGWADSLISDDDVSTVAELIADVETGMERMRRCGLSTDEYLAQLVPLVEDALLYASDTHRSQREAVKARQMLAKISKEDIDNDDELQRLHDDRRAIEGQTSTAFARWMDTRWKLENLGSEIHEEADLAEAKLAAARWNAEHGNGRN